MAKKANSSVYNSSGFPVMGESLLSHILNVSGQRSPYTKTVAKQTMGRGASPTGKSAIRPHTMIKEANGPKCSIQATLYKANAAEASQTLRNTSMVPTVIERPDRVGSAKTFWTERRQYKQKTY